MPDSNLPAADGPTELERLASAFLRGDNDEAVDTMARAHTMFLASGDLQGAALP